MAIRDDQMVDLTAKEYDLIELLMRNPRRVYSRENLMNVVWGYSYGGDYRTVDVHIRRLRKAGAQSGGARYILTKWEWATISKGKTRVKNSLQLKFGLSYILLIAAVLVLLNTYPLLVSEDLVFRSRRPPCKTTSPSWSPLCRG